MAVDPRAGLSPRAATEPDMGYMEGLIEWGQAVLASAAAARWPPGGVRLRRRAKHPWSRSGGALYFILPRLFFRIDVLGNSTSSIEASALLDDPNYWTQCWMMTAVWVRKPLPNAGTAST